MSRRTLILFWLALGMSLPMALQFRNASLSCASLGEAGWGAEVQSILGRVPGRDSFMYCAPNDPTRTTSAVLVLSWMTFCGAAAYFGLMDLAAYWGFMGENDMFQRH